MKKRTSFKEKGITLIALIVTIIVLLILAGVTIATITGNRGIISKAKDSTSKYTQRQAEEQATILMQEYAMENAEKGTRIGDFLEEKKTKEKVIDGYKVNENGSVDIIKDKYIISFDKNLALTDFTDTSTLPKDTDTMIYHFENIPEDAIQFTVTKDNRGKVGFKGVENEELIIPCAFKDSDGKWYKVVEFKSGCFQETNVKDVTLPYGITKISDGLFYGCKELVSVKAFDGVTSVGSGSFSGCTNLTTASIPNSVTFISSGAFNNCTRLQSIQIPNSVTSIGDNAFFNCTSLTSLVFPDSIETIGSSAFSGTGLTEINLPKSIKLINPGAFNNCNNVQTININCDTLEIKDRVFGIGGNIKEIYISGNTIVTGSCPFQVKNGKDIVITIRCKSANLQSVLIGCLENGNTTIKSVNITSDELKMANVFNLSHCTIENLTLDCNKASFGTYTITGTAVKNLNFKGTKEKWQQFEFASNWIMPPDAVKVVHCTDGDLALQ